MLIHIIRSWNSETKPFYKKINEIIYALLALAFGLYYPLLILRFGKDHKGVVFPTAVEELTFLGNLLIVGVMLGIFAWGLSAKIRTIRNPELLKTTNNYELFCEECGVPAIDEKCTHDINNECIRTMNFAFDHMGLVHNPEMEGTGICIIARPLDMVLEKQGAKFQSLFKKNPNKYDIVCQICKIEKLQLGDIDIENWLFHRGISQSWISDFLEVFDIHLPIYDDKEYTKKEFKDVYNKKAKGILILGTIPF